MGRRGETALGVLEKAATEYFYMALPESSYRGFVAVNPDGTVIGGGGIVINPWPGVLGQLRAKRAMILNLYV